MSARPSPVDAPLGRYLAELLCEPLADSQARSQDQSQAQLQDQSQAKLRDESAAGQTAESHKYLTEPEASAASRAALKRSAFLRRLEQAQLARTVEGVANGEDMRGAGKHKAAKQSLHCRLFRVEGRLLAVAESDIVGLEAPSATESGATNLAAGSESASFANNMLSAAKRAMARRSVFGAASSRQQSPPQASATADASRSRRRSLAASLEGLLDKVGSDGGEASPTQLNARPVGRDSQPRLLHLCADEARLALWVEAELEPVQLKPAALQLAGQVVAGLPPGLGAGIAGLCALPERSAEALFFSSAQYQRAALAATVLGQAMPGSESMDKK